MSRPAVSYLRGDREPIPRIDVGKVSVHPLVQFHYRIDPPKFFPELAVRAVDEHAWYWHPPYTDDGYLVVDMGGFLVRTPTRNILVDLGVGDGKRRPNPHFNDRADDWPAVLARTGVAMADVDTVVYTHLHVDHVGNGTRLIDGRWTPAFPAVPHLVTKTEFDFWTSDTAQVELNRLGNHIMDSVLPIQEAGLLEFVAPDHEVCPEVRLRSAAGHTPGNVCVEVESEGQRAVFAGDMVHHALQLAFPDWSTDFCVDGHRAAGAREALLAEIADTETLLFPAHFPNSYPGRVRRAPGRGYTYETETGADD
jgi:glyoxylase-like metal-dependent hydrolase (beta-lactamase superfamily II)